MNRSFSVLRRRLLASVFLLAIPALCLGQPLTWVGGANGTSQQLRLGTNWNTGTAPDESSDLFIAATVNTTVPTLLVNDVMAVRSFTFDNAAGKFSATNGLRIAATTNTTVNTQAYIFFNTAGTIITALNNTNASFRGASLSASSTANPLPSLRLDFNFSGLGTVNVETGSIVLIAEGSQNVPGATALGTGGLSKIGGGTLRLNGNHTYSGGFVLHEGKVIITASGTNTTDSILASPWGTGTLTLRGGTLDSSSNNGRTVRNPTILDGDITITSGETNSGSFLWSAGAGQSTTLASNSTLNITQSVNWSQSISGNFGLTKTGTGTLLTHGGHTYSGGFTLNGGTLEISTSGDTLDGVLTNSAVGTGTLTLKDGLIQSTTSTARTIYPSVDLDGAVAITGTFVDPVDPAITRTGNFIVSTTGGGVTRLLSNSTLTIAQAVNWNQDISGSASLTKTGPGTLRLNGINTYTGGTIVAEGTLQGDAASITGNVVNNAALVFSEDTGGTYAGVISGSGTVTKQGTAALTLTGTHTYTGLTSLTEGSLVIDGSIPGALDTAAATTLAGSGTIGGHATVAGAHSPGNSTGTQTFGANLTYATGSTIGWDLAANTAAAASSDQVIVAGALDFAGPVTLTPTVAGNGSTVDWKNAFWLEEHSWVVFDAATVSNFQNLQLSPSTWLDATGASFDSALAGASFALSQSGGDVVLTYTPPPVIADPYTTWRAQYFSTEELNLPAVSGSLADPDGDGFANLLEYALGLDPRTAHPAAVPATSAENGFWIFLYTRPANRSDVNYIVQVSTNLQLWITIASMDHEQVAVVGETATWRARYSQTGAPNAFFRLRVEPVTVQ